MGMDTRKTLIRAGLLIDGTGAPPLQSPVILLEGNRIREVQEVPPGRDYEGAFDQVLDYGDRTIIPGLIDTHVHLTFNGAGTSEAVNSGIIESDDRELVAQALTNAQLSLSRGVTTVRDCGDRDFISLTLRELESCGNLICPRILASGPAITTTGGHLGAIGLRADTTDELIKAVRKLASRDVDHVKIMVTGGNSTPSSNSQMAQYSQEQLEVVVEEAHRFGLRVTAHVLAAEGMRSAITAGVDSIEHGQWLSPPANMLDRPSRIGVLRDSDTFRRRLSLKYDEEFVGRLAESETYWGNTLTGLFWPLLESYRDGHEHGFRPNSRLPLPRSYLLDRLQLFQKMFEQGVKMMLSTDAGVRLTPFGGLAYSAAVAVAHMGLTELEAIKAVTSIPAAAIGLGDDLGSLKAGYLADMVVLETNPLDSIDALADPFCVIKNGEEVARGGFLHA